MSFKKLKFSFNIHRWAYGFTKNLQIGEKLTETRYFFIVTPYYASILYNNHIYEFLHVLKKLKVLLKIHRLAYDFTENHQFGVKTDRNSIFLGRDRHILDRLYITVPYMSFYGFFKKSNFRSKFIGVSLRFYRISQVWGKN
jgi:hypothetical protein